MITSAQAGEVLFAEALIRPVIAAAVRTSVIFPAQVGALAATSFINGIAHRLVRNHDDGSVRWVLSDDS
jgi:hypothetical protein